MTKYVGLAVAAVLASFHVALAQDKPIELPLVQDRQPLEGYGKSKADVLGVRFGETRANTVRIVKAAFPNADIREIATAMTIKDNRDNRIVWRYDNAIQISVPGEPTEHFTIRFTSALSGGRVYYIERSTRYPENKFADMKTIRDAIAQKYGEPTVVERYDHQNSVDLTFTWEKRPVERFPEQDVRNRSFKAAIPSNVNPCLNAATSPAYMTASGPMYSYQPAGARKGNPGWDVCIGGIKITLHYGNNPQTVRVMNVKATDYDRSMHDARLLDETLSKMIADKANAVTGTTAAPKL